LFTAADKPAVFQCSRTDSVDFIWEYRSRNFFCKIFLKDTTGGSMMAAVPQLVGELQFLEKARFS
jgi:hypothetical protein